MSNLKEVNLGANKFCGPAVLSILTGKNTDECARVISSINGQYVIKGVETSHLLEAASRLGFDSEVVSHATTLYGTLVRLARNDGIYIVTVTKHFVCIEVEGGTALICDNHTKQPMDAAASARLLQQVKSVHRIFKRREPVEISSKIVCTTKFVNNRIVVEITQKITYDIEKYNRDLSVARFGFNTRDEMKEFVKSLLRGFRDWKPDTTGADDYTKRG